MDILIPNMEMPNNYPYRLTLHSDGHIEDHSGYSGHGHYKAIPVPKHNDLIDKAVVVDRIGDVYEKLWDDADKDTLSKFHVEILKAILGTPVVVESNEEEYKETENGHID